MFSRNMCKELHSAHSGVVKIRLLARPYTWRDGMNQGIETTAKMYALYKICKQPPEGTVYTWKLHSWKRFHAEFPGQITVNLFLAVVQAILICPRVNEKYYNRCHYGRPHRTS